MKANKARDYCCCAIPMVNAGIYATLIEQTAAGILVGTLSIATPSIVGASTPSFAAWILAILAYIAAGVQFLGFVGVSRVCLALVFSCCAFDHLGMQEKPSLYKRYVTLHGIVISISFSIAAAWIITSATRHSNAKAKCLTDFFSNGDSSTTSEGDTLCTIFPWVDVGIMGGLWVLLAVLHTYLFFVISSYGTAQRRDHGQYDQVYDPSRPLTESIPLQNDPWDSRPSGDYHDMGGRQTGDYKHIRQHSSISTSDVYNQPYQEPKDSFSTSNYDYSAYPSQPQNAQDPAYPLYAHTQTGVPTPTANYYNIPEDSRIERPLQAQSHPGE